MTNEVAIACLRLSAARLALHRSRASSRTRECLARRNRSASSYRSRRAASTTWWRGWSRRTWRRSLGQPVDHRQPARRKRHRRHERRRQGGARRPHAADGGVELHGPSGHPGASCPMTRSATWRRSAWWRRTRCCSWSIKARRQDAARIRRARQDQSGQAQLRLARGGDPDPPGGRAVQPARRHSSCSTSRIAAARRPSRRCWRTIRSSR